MRDKKIERTSDTPFYLHPLFPPTCKERIPWELRCALVEVQSKTALITTKSIKGPTLLSARACEGLRKIERTSDTAFYLHPLFPPTCKERIPWELRCALVEIQSKTALVTTKSIKGPTLLSARACEGLRKIERTSDTAFYLHPLFPPTCKERIPWELRCALVEIQSKTALVTTKSIKGPTLLSARACEGLRKIERTSDTAFYLHPLFPPTCKERIPWELRCALVEIQSKTALVTTKSIKGPTLLSARACEGLRVIPI
ncbi:hypothetical protein V1478_005369 [Vespula squamosa]|uniref:Uncharacterized protein n=1 Tax=Vespula squamosa TaxID=30214 RepID=A0ABD2BDZ2_VESSQ